MKRTLIVKNFGPIKDLKLDLKDVNVFIGPQSTGKSTIAKLLSVLLDVGTYDPEVDIKESFKNKKINYITKNSFIQYIEGKEEKLLIQNGKVKSIQKIKMALVLKMIGTLQGRITDKNILVDDDILISELKKIVKERTNNFIRDTGAIIDRAQVNSKSKRSAKLKSFLDILKEGIKIRNPEKTDIVIPIDDPIYIPAERILLPMILESSASIHISKIPFPEYIYEFGNKFEIARNNLNNSDYSFLKMKLHYENGVNHVVEQDTNAKYKLSDSSTGIQSIIPILAVIDHYAKEYPHPFIIEEPELNLFPSTQKHLVEFLVENCINVNNGNLILTTHSPYILTALNNLIQADNTFRIKPDLEKKISKTIPKKRWLSYDRVGVYYFENGKAKSMMNKKNRLIDANPLDEVSEELGREYNQLTDLEFSK